MLKGGVIMDVVTPEEARIAEEAGAVAVMALERVPADIRREGGVARMSDPDVSAPPPPALLFFPPRADYGASAT
jgi:pyridoxal 5'-phosphate synthase pdxS subunit